jgi:hypothetical protein
MQNQTLKALSILTNHTVRHLLMGGQACVLYGAVQFSRDADLAVLATTENLDRLGKALSDLDAEVIAVPPFDVKYLELGLAVHFRCRRPEFNNLRIDVMSVMRGVDSFPQLWDRRTTLELPAGAVDVLNIADLVKAKKTQRDKDWPMIRALVEAHYAQNQSESNPESVKFWLREARTPEILTEVARQSSGMTNVVIKDRPLLEFAISNSVAQLRRALLEEQQQEQERDRLYWQPLVAELEKLRHNRRRAN